MPREETGSSPAALGAQGAARGRAGGRGERLCGTRPRVLQNRRGRRLAARGGGAARSEWVTPVTSKSRNVLLPVQHPSVKLLNYPRIRNSYEITVMQQYF